MLGHTERLQAQFGCTLSSRCSQTTLECRFQCSERPQAHNLWCPPSLLPAIAYTLDMYRRTGEFFGINEALFASALAAIVFSTLGAQPLTIVGVTGLISLFNFTIYDIIRIYDISIYPQFMAWTGIWAAIFHWMVAVFNACDYMRYVTDFSSESFGLYVGIIYISMCFSILHWSFVC